MSVRARVRQSERERERKREGREPQREREKKGKETKIQKETLFSAQPSARGRRTVRATKRTELSENRRHRSSQAPAEGGGGRRESSSLPLPATALTQLTPPLCLTCCPSACCCCCRASTRGRSTRARCAGSCGRSWQSAGPPQPPSVRCFLASPFRAGRAAMPLPTATAPERRLVEPPCRIACGRRSCRVAAHRRSCRAALCRHRPVTSIDAPVLLTPVPKYCDLTGLRVRKTTTVAPPVPRASRATFSSSSKAPTPPRPSHRTHARLVARRQSTPTRGHSSTTLARHSTSKYRP